MKQLSESSKSYHKVKESESVRKNLRRKEKAEELYGKEGSPKIVPDVSLWDCDDVDGCCNLKCQFCSNGSHFSPSQNLKSLITKTTSHL